MILLSDNILFSFLHFEIWIIAIMILVVYTCTQARKWQTHTYFPIQNIWKIAIIMAIIFPPLMSGLWFCLGLTCTALTKSEKNKVLFPMLRHCMCNIELESTGIDLSSIDCSSTIFICNYPANFIEYMFLPMLLEQYGIKAGIVVGKTAKKWARVFIDPESLISMEASGNFSSLAQKLEASCSLNICPIVYPERNFWKRRTVDEIVPFRSGIFEIARQLKKTCIIVHIDHLRHMCGIITQKQINFKMAKSTDYSPENNYLLMKKLQNTPREY
jgi:hypothetical protein